MQGYDHLQRLDITQTGAQKNVDIIDIVYQCFIRKIYKMGFFLYGDSPTPIVEALDYEGTG